MSDTDAGESRDDPRPPLRGRPSGGRIPGWTLVILGAAVGGFVSGWMGGILGAGLGLLIWKGRS